MRHGRLFVGAMVLALLWLVAGTGPVFGQAGVVGQPDHARSFEVKRITFELVKAPKMASKPEALISLDRKMHVQAEQMRRKHSSIELPSNWLIRLFEDLDTVRDLRSYLDRVWDYATQSRQTTQSAENRFSEIIPEVFIAGSD